ncbi:hypothetical protein [Ornithinibacillus sp. FSL M8-0202]|uniref:hypothetical protein n=1 Tax=Ornithinibacillus sp. FSL M8-0202 TaxID=2921616 RepID=UPI0030D4C04D
MIETLGYPRYEQADAFYQENTVTADKVLPHVPSQVDINERLLILSYELAPHEADIKWIESECSKYGIKIEWKVVAYANFMEEAMEADLVLSEYVTEDVEEVALLNLFRSETSILHNVLDQEYGSILQDLYEQCLQQESKEHRMELIKRMESILLNHHIVMPLYSTYQKALYHERLMGVSLSTIGLMPFKDLFYRIPN